jgi:hypothetical protein
MKKRIQTTTFSVDEYTRRTPLADVLPFKFTNGYELTYLDIYCAQCNDKIEPKDVRVDFDTAGKEDYRSKTVELVYFDGYAPCKSCDMYTPFKVAVTDKLGLIVVKKNFLEFYGDGKRDTYGTRFKRWIRSLFKKG